MQVLDAYQRACAVTREHSLVVLEAAHLRAYADGGEHDVTLIGPIRILGWITLGTMFATANRERFVHWLRVRLLPRLRNGDVLVMDNATAHHAPQVAHLCKAAGVRLLYLPPYSPDFNPIEPAWALQNSTFGSTRLAIHGLFGVWPAARGTESRSVTVAIGLLMRDTGLDPTDPWG
jgi:hypothetical protein